MAVIGVEASDMSLVLPEKRVGFANYLAASNCAVKNQMGKRSE